MKFINSILDFLYPKTSIISDERLDEYNSNDFVSDEELRSLRKVTSNDLKDLALKINADYTLSYIAFYENDDFSKIIYRLKYAGMKKIGIFLGELLGRELKTYFEKNKINKFDYIIPVPLHRTKLRERGYNQSDFICKGLSAILQAEYKPDVLKRIRHTVSQTKLDRKDRIANVKDAFVFNEKHRLDLRGKRVLIADDVVTTGSTINEAVKIIKENTGNEVMAVTVAMARD